MTQKFSARVEIIGVNPYVIPPQKVLDNMFKEAGKDKGAIPIKGTLNGHKFIQTLVKYSGAWRLYLNGPMRKASGLDVGDMVRFEISYDSASRLIPMHPKFKLELSKNKKAKEAFKKFPPSRQKEINRYLNNIKSDVVRDKNIERTVKHLAGEKVGYFVLLRNKPPKTS